MENLVDASLNDLTNMIHTYKRKLNGEVTRVKTVDTISKLRKRPDCVHSITTVTSELRNDFIENVWKPKKIMAESRANPDWDLSKITESCWGYRRCAETGEQITSSEFGTQAHECMENLLVHLKEGSDYKSAYEPLCRPFLWHVESSCLSPELMEHMVLDEKRRVGGTVDFIATSDRDKYEVFDFKFRGNTKCYDKDLLQLAVAADILMKDLNLDYLPKCHSVVFNWETGDMKINTWGQRETWEAIGIFGKLNDVFIWRNGL